MDRVRMDTKAVSKNDSENHELRTRSCSSAQSTDKERVPLRTVNTDNVNHHLILRRINDLPDAQQGAPTRRFNSWATRPSATVASTSSSA